MVESALGIGFQQGTPPCCRHVGVDFSVGLRRSEHVSLRKEKKSYYTHTTVMVPEDCLFLATRNQLRSVGSTDWILVKT